MATYYSAYDLQLNQYFHTGRNSKSREECRDLIVEYLLDGSQLPEDDLKVWRTVPEEVLEAWEVRIDEHNKKIEEED